MVLIAASRAEGGLLFIWKPSKRNRQQMLFLMNWAKIHVNINSILSQVVSKSMILQNNVQDLIAGIQNTCSYKT